MKEKMATAMQLVAGCLIVLSCAQPTMEERYAQKAEEAADLKGRIHELEGQIATLGAAKETAEREAGEWRNRSGDLEKKLLSLRPEVLLPFEPDDLKENQIVLQRVFSIRTGRCFNEKGEPSCLYLKLGEKDGTAFVVYKANRVFIGNSKASILHNSYGQALSLVTRDIAQVILDSEKKNPEQQIRLEGY